MEPDLEPDTTAAESDTPPETPTPDAAALDLIREANAEVDRRRLSYEDAKDLAASRKKSYELAVEELQEVIRKATEPTPPLVEFAEKQQEDAWRAVPLTEALEGLPPKVYWALNAADLVTMGDYADFCNSGKVLGDLKGIGEAKLSQIMTAEEAFWARWNKQRQQGQGGEEAEGQ